MYNKLSIILLLKQSRYRHTGATIALPVLTISERFMCRAQNELLERGKRQEEERKKNVVRHADEVRTQIRNKERERIAQRNNFFEEGVRLDEQAHARRALLDDAKRKKMDELRSVHIYIYIVLNLAIILVFNLLLKSSAKRQICS